MTHQDIIQQLEFFRDIGVQTISLLDARPAAAASDSPSKPSRPSAPTSAIASAASSRRPARTSYSVPEIPTRKSCSSVKRRVMKRTSRVAFRRCAGQLLTKIIESIGIKREDAYICNILKCRPPDNRNPEPDEVLACSPFLKRQIAAIRPKIVCCLGKFAAQTMLQQRRSHIQAARKIPRHRRHARHRDVPPGLSAALSRKEARGLGRHETDPRRTVSAAVLDSCLQTSRFACLCRARSSTNSAEPAEIGCRVRVRFPNREVEGFVVGSRRLRRPASKFSPYREVLDLPPFSCPDILDLCRWISDYYLAPIGEVLKSALPPAITRRNMSIDSIQADRRRTDPKARCAVQAHHRTADGALRN